MAQTKQTVQRGDVYLMPFGSGKPRPVVVVSRDTANGGDGVVVVPFTTQKIEERKHIQTYVFFAKDEGSFKADCLAATSEVTLVLKTRIDWEKGRLFRLNEPQMQRIVRALRYLFRDSELEPSAGCRPAQPHHDAKTAAIVPVEGSS
jgi:mRNA-degrading endonuclease toxin of MazEF toxin-antitoxin module